MEPAASAAMTKTSDQCAVLIVEDDAPIRKLVRMVLERHRYHVDTAADGVEAVLKLGLADFDVVILDLMMPNLDGFAFIETISAHDPSMLRKIIVTSAASPAIVAERLKGTPFAVLSKPFDLDQLIELVRACAQQA